MNNFTHIHQFCHLEDHGRSPLGCILPQTLLHIPTVSFTFWGISVSENITVILTCGRRCITRITLSGLLFFRCVGCLFVFRACQALLAKEVSKLSHMMTSSTSVDRFLVSYSLRSGPGYFIDGVICLLFCLFFFPYCITF